jgi:hypothetical protein
MLFSQLRNLSGLVFLGLANISGVFAWSAMVNDVALEFFLGLVMVIFQSLVGLAVWRIQSLAQLKLSEENYDRLRKRARTFILAVEEKGRRGNTLFQVGQAKKDAVMKMLKSFAELIGITVTDEELEHLIDSMVLELLNQAKSATVPTS